MSAMESYSRTQAMAVVSGSDPVSVWTVPSGETGLEEPMWQLGLGVAPESYPERPGEADCLYYLRNGFCGYGASCRFNHPRDRTAVMGALRNNRGDYPERTGQPVCQYYIKTGTCKFGASCKYHHPSHGSGSPIPTTLNIYGYPLRPGDKECSYYVKTGQCKFGVTCKFNHPQPTGLQVVAPAPGVYPNSQPPVQSSQQHGVVPGSWQIASPVQSSQQHGVVPGSWQIASPGLVPGSYIPGTYGPVLLPSGMVSVPGWTSYPAPVSPAVSANTQATIGGSSVYGLTPLSSSAAAYTGQYLSVSDPGVHSGCGTNEGSLPERPGQTECMYYMKTGDCKFGPSCRYHHPPNWTPENTTFALSPMGLPLHPDAPICSHYVQNGECKFGPSCRFDHPIGTWSLTYNPSTSSHADMLIAPYPVGSSIATLAPSSSSSTTDIRFELINSGSSRISSAIATIEEEGGLVTNSRAVSKSRSGLSSSSDNSSEIHVS